MMEMEKMKKGAVAFLDILGFKGIWRRKKAEDVLKLMTGVSELIEERKKKLMSDDHNSQLIPLQATTLSDTIVISLEAKNSTDYSCILNLADIMYNIMRHFFIDKLFVRGAIGYGEYTTEGNTFLGSAIDDVAAWYEQANWIGIISTPRTSFILDAYESIPVNINNFIFDQFIKYSVPGNDSLLYHLNVYNWPCYLQASFKEAINPKKSKARSKMENLFALQDPFDASVLEKYENTLNFVDYSMSLMRQTRDGAEAGLS